MKLWYFSSPTLKLCLGVCWATKVSEWTKTWPTLTCLPSDSSQRGVANSTQPLAHSSGRFYAALEHSSNIMWPQLISQGLTEVPLCYFCALFSFDSPPAPALASFPSKFCAYSAPKSFNILAPLVPTLSLPQTPLILLVPVFLTPCFRWPSPSPLAFLPCTFSRTISGVQCPSCSCFKECFPLNSWGAPVASKVLSTTAPPSSTSHSFLLRKAARQERSACPGWPEQQLLETEDGSVSLPGDSPGLLVRCTAARGAKGLVWLLDGAFSVHSPNYCLISHS